MYNWNVRVKGQQRAIRAIECLCPKSSLTLGKNFAVRTGRLPEAFFMVFYWIPKVLSCCLSALHHVEMAETWGALDFMPLTQYLTSAARKRIF